MISRASAGSYTSKLVKGFKAARPNDKVVVYGPRGEKRDERYITLVETWTSNLFPFQIFRRLCRDKPQVVHIQHEFGMFGQPATMSLVPMLYIFLKLLRIRIVSTLHSMVFPDSLSSGSIRELLPTASWVPKTIIEIGLQIVYGSACRLSDVVVVHQPSHKTKLRRYYRIKGAKISLIPHGVGQTEYAATHESLSRWKSTMGNNRVALYFGYLSPRKGIDYLIDAFETFSQQNPDWMLILAGGLSKNYYRPYLEHIKDTIARRKLGTRILLTGFVSEGDADAMYTLCDFVVLPYTQVVGNASACNLAMGYGKPVIASNLSPFSEEIEDGHHGILCPPQNSAQILAALEKLSSNVDLYKEMCVNLQQIKVSRGWESVADRTYGLYELPPGSGP